MNNSTLTLKQIEFVAKECKRQQSGEMSVSYMCGAYSLALHQNLPTMDFIVQLGKLIEPLKNYSGFRQVPVTKKGGEVIGISHAQVDRAMSNLVDAMLTFGALSPEEVYYEAMRIHCWRDGNGRFGAILYNFLKGTLENPITPPEYKE